MFSTIKKDFPLSCSVFVFIITLAVLKRVFGLKRLLEFSYPKKKTKVKNKKVFSKNLVRITSLLFGENLGMNSNCLLKSLVYFHFLNKAGINAKIYFGIEKNFQQLRQGGHAWVAINDNCFSQPAEGLKEEFESICYFPE